MSNHVHLLTKADPEKIPLFMKKLEISYAIYFNRSKNHSGHLFQNRYKSEAVLDDTYLLTVLRYILRNPQEAGIGNWRDYRWSSAGCYISGTDDGVTDGDFLLAVSNGREELVDFIDSDERDNFRLAEPAVERVGLSDEEALEVLREISGIREPIQLQNMDKGKCNILIFRWRRRGASMRQIERLTGINRNSI